MPYLCGARWVLVCTLAMSACIQADLVPCGDKVCASGDVCVMDRCASQDQIDACAMFGDGASCTYDGLVGVCDRGICVAGACGNVITDPGEACDDGNVVSGDGCRADCKKTETCGDAERDEGEACDDGNDNPADGCDQCIATTWAARAVISPVTDPLKVTFGPQQLARDVSGNIYICDSERVFRLDTNGRLVAIAGTGVPGFSGDGGPATAAQLFEAGQIAD